MARRKPHWHWLISPLTGDYSTRPRSEDSEVSSGVVGMSSTISKKVTTAAAAGWRRRPPRVRDCGRRAVPAGESRRVQPREAMAAAAILFLDGNAYRSPVLNQMVESRNLTDQPTSR